MDFTTLTQIAGSLTNATSLVKTIIAARDEAKRAAAVHELQSELADAYGKLLSITVSAAKSAEEHQAVLREKRELEERLRAAETEKTDFERYALKQLSPGVLVYALRKDLETTEPFHYLCTHCRNEGKKSILQRRWEGLELHYACLACKSTYDSGQRTAPNVRLPH